MNKPVSFLQLKPKQNQPDLSIPLLLYILKHRQMKEELESNCIAHYLTIPQHKGQVLLLAGKLVSLASTCRLRSSL